ncbi:MAG TPA: ABC transporter permease [Acidobacteriota bacterium]|nr:ABC transporter permease [Acidobacteriota bacterium]
MNKLLLVARREYIATVNRKGFLIATFGMPLFLALIFGFFAVIGFFTARSVQEGVRLVGIVDEAGVLSMQARQDAIGDSSPPEGLDDILDQVPGFLRGLLQSQIERAAKGPDLQLLESRQEAGEDDSVDAYYVIPEDFRQSGQVELYRRSGGTFDDDRPAWSTLQRWIRASLVSGMVEPSTARLLWSPLRLKTHGLDGEGEAREVSSIFEQIRGFVVPYLFTIIFFMAVMSSAGYLLQGVAEEKENRVIEILLSSVTSDQLLAGKVLGQCGAGLTQIGVWLLIAFIPAVSLLPFLEFRPVQFITAPLYFILGFLLFGTLMGAFGSLGNNVKESQQWAMVWSIAAVSPFFAIAIILQQPNGMLAKVLSFIPLTSPLTMVLRTSMTDVPPWEIALSLLILILSLFVVVRLSAKLFRVGVLLYGKRPSLREVARWMRAA